MLKVRDGMLQGTLNGMLVNCALRPGVSIPRGTYKLLPAVQDPVFGTLVAMVPASGQLDQRRQQAEGLKIDTVKGLVSNDRRSAPPFARGDGIKTISLGHAGQSDLLNVGILHQFKYDSLEKNQSSQGFVLSARPMPGTSNIVVSSGFSSLVEGLSKGEAMVEAG